MHEVSVLIVLVVLTALAFDYINGFHDTANAIATVVSTRVLTPRAAIIMAAVPRPSRITWAKSNRAVQRAGRQSPSKPIT